MQYSVKSTQDISKLIRMIRIEKGLSQEKAAALAGVGRRFLSELERGEKDSLDMGKVFQVLRKFGIKVFIQSPLDVGIDG